MEQIEQQYVHTVGRIAYDETLIAMNEFSHSHLKSERHLPS
jgi:hypothetical protein